MKKAEKKIAIPYNARKHNGNRVVINVRKTHRNDKCPCGSGNKFKNCCLEN